MFQGVNLSFFDKSIKNLGVYIPPLGDLVKINIVSFEYKADVERLPALFNHCGEKPK